MNGVFFGVIGGTIGVLIIAFKGIKQQKEMNDKLKVNVLNKVETLLDELAENRRKEDQARKEILDRLERLEALLEQK